MDKTARGGEGRPVGEEMGKTAREDIETNQNEALILQNFRYRIEANCPIPKILRSKRNEQA